MTEMWIGEGDEARVLSIGELIEEVLAAMDGEKDGDEDVLG